MLLRYLHSLHLCNSTEYMPKARRGADSAVKSPGAITAQGENSKQAS